MENNKRTTLKVMTGVGTALACHTWSKPILNSIVLPAHAQTSTPDANQAPIGENITVSARGDGAIAIDLNPRVSDPDGDPVTISLVGSGVLDGAGRLEQAEIVDGVLQVRVSNGSVNIFVDYNVSDGMATSPTYRVTVNDLDGPFS